MDNNKISENLYALYRATSGIANINICKIGSHEYVRNLNSAWPNMIFNTNLEKSITNDELQALAEEIKKNDLPKTLLLDERIITNDNLICLKQIGFMPVTQWINMTLPIFVNPDKGLAKEFEIKVIDSENSFRLSEWVAIVKQVLFPKEKLDADIFKFGIDNNIFKLFIGYYNEIPVATTLLYLGENAGIYMVATLQEFRKKGLAKAILNEVHSFASNLGYKNTILHSTNMGVKLYQSLGYEQKGKMILFYSL